MNIKYLFLIHFLFAITFSFSQCDQANIIVNGNFNSLKGTNVIAEGWTGIGTPDINDQSDALNTSEGYFWNGEPLISENGGTWQNIFSFEYVEQEVTLEIGKEYELGFEFASQAIKHEYVELFDFNSLGAVNIYFNDSLEFTSSISDALFQWENVCYNFIASEPNITIRFESALGEYVALDGVFLSEVNLAFDLGENFEVCEQREVFLGVQMECVNYLWSTGSNEPIIDVSQGGLYWVEISSLCSTKRDSIFVDFKNDCCDIYVPNIISKSSQNENLSFSIKSGCLLSNTFMSIYDRWGNLLFESSGIDVSWDGTYNNKPVIQGTYVALIEVLFRDGKSRSLTQDFLLIN